MADEREADPGRCGCELDDASACVFAKALLARHARCECSRRAAFGERLAVQCSSPVARTNCGTAMALLRERARFALRLPPPGQPMLHVQALRLQSGLLGALALRFGDGADAEADAHRLLRRAMEQCGSLVDLPWGEIVPSVVSWRTAPRRPPR